MFECYEDIVTPEELSEMLKMGMSQIYQLLKSGELKAYRAERMWKIPKKAVEEYVCQKSGLQSKRS